MAGKAGNKISLIHLDALYDLLNKSYVSVDFQTKKTLDERASLCEMLYQNSLPENSILLADRGYESFNVFEHLKQLNQHFVIRVKDIKNNGFLHHLPPSAESDCFDQVIHFKLTRRQTKAIKNDPNFCFLSNNSKFDFLPIRSREWSEFSYLPLIMSA
ncbi:transposase [Lactococcus lactis]|uniref:Transposase n=1 Tax=Lactococcus lactis TaxID=1358 RepID=A0A9X4NIY4_9LACT|nr:transposase [Lactococcus lactis]MDG4983868.1 transposase [Lactococcus lactis]